METRRREVLDSGFVELIDFMGDDDAPVDAARVSFEKSANQYTTEQNDRLMRFLIDNEHGSPLEMVTFKFRVSAPVVVWWHWVRHRMSNFNFASGRYIPFKENRVYIPTSWRIQSKTNKQGSDPDARLSPELSEEFNKRRDDLYLAAYGLYNEMLEHGVAREQARLVLPFAAVYYEAIFQANARSLMNFIALREKPDAQLEIREYAKAIKSIVSETHPRIFPADKPVRRV